MCLWFVVLAALGLRVATSTWNNFKRGSVEYHQRLANECEMMSTSNWRWAQRFEDESSSRSISDPAIAAERRLEATSCTQSARSYSLLAASLAEKAESCEQSPIGWIFLQYETSRNPPDLPVRHVSGAKPPLVESGTFLHSTLMTLAHLDLAGITGLALAVVVRRRFARSGRIGSRPPAPSTP